MDRFDLYFSSLVGMTLHPGAGKNGARVLSLEDCVLMALRMCQLRMRYQEEIDLCLCGSQAPELSAPE